MLTETVLVTAVNENNITVKLNKHSACSCCKTPFICASIGSRELIIDNNSDIEINPGDSLQVGMEEKFTITASFFAFGMPALIFIATLLITRNNPPILSFTTAMGIIFVYYLLIRNILKNNKSFAVTILKKT